MTDAEFAGYCRTGVAGTDNRRWADLVANARYVHGGYDDPATYQRLAELLAGVRRAAADGRQSGLLLRHTAAAVRADRDQPRQGRPERPRRRRLRPGGHREAVRVGRDERRGPLRRPVDGVRRGADLPHRPLPGQGDGAEPAGAAVRELDLRAHLEPHLGGQRADHRRRDPRASANAAGSTRRRGRCATSCRTTCCRCCRCSSWSRPTSFHPEAIRDEKVKLLRAIQPLDDEADIATRRPRAVHPRRHPGDLMPGTGRSPASTR
jgi:hypothetical protein